MTAWSIEQMRESVENKSAFAVGGSFAKICDYAALPEKDADAHGGPSQETVPAPAGVLVDIQTANMLVTVYDALNETNRWKFAALSLERAVEVGWKLVA